MYASLRWLFEPVQNWKCSLCTSHQEVLDFNIMLCAVSPGSFSGGVFCLLLELGMTLIDKSLVISGHAAKSGYGEINAQNSKLLGETLLYTVCHAAELDVFSVCICIRDNAVESGYCLC